MSKVYLLSFYTEGFPADSGVNLTSIAEQFFQYAKPHFNQVFMANPTSICTFDKNFLPLVKDYTDYDSLNAARYSLPHNKEWAKVGFMMWKPRLIRVMLEKINEGDILLFHDINFKKYPQYLSHMQEWPDELASIHQAGEVILFRDSYKPLCIDCKSHLINKFIRDKFLYPELLPGFWAGMLSLKKSKFALDFIESWMAITENLEHSSPYPDSHSSNIDSRFVWHSQEQATLAVNYYLNIKKYRHHVVTYSIRGRSFPRIGIDRLAPIIFFGRYFYLFTKNLVKIFLLRRLA